LSPEKASSGKDLVLLVPIICSKICPFEQYTI